MRSLRGWLRHYGGVLVIAALLASAFVWVSSFTEHLSSGLAAVLGLLAALPIALLRDKHGAPRLRFGAVEWAEVLIGDRRYHVFRVPVENYGRSASTGCKGTIRLREVDSTIEESTFRPATTGTDGQVEEPFRQVTRHPRGCDLSTCRALVDRQPPPERLANEGVLTLRVSWVVRPAGPDITLNRGDTEYLEIHARSVDHDPPHVIVPTENGFNTKQPRANRVLCLGISHVEVVVTAENALPIYGNLVFAPPQAKRPPHDRFVPGSKTS